MSITSIQNNIFRFQKEIANVQGTIATKRNKISEAQAKALKAQTEANKAKSQATLNSKLSEYKRQCEAANKLMKEMSSLEKKLSLLQHSLNNEEKKLAKEQESMQKKLEAKNKAEVKKEQKRQSDLQKKYDSRIKELENSVHESVANSLSLPTNLYNQSDDAEYDVLISHASEDKESFVDDLYYALKNKGISVWYDSINIKWGDSLRAKIDEGLSHSKYGIIILSPDYIKKGWTQYELEGLFNKEMTNGKTILPIWHNLTKTEVQKFSPTLAGRLALSSATKTPDEIAEELYKLISEN